MSRKLPFGVMGMHFEFEWETGMVGCGELLLLQEGSGEKCAWAMGYGGRIRKATTKLGRPTAKSVCVEKALKHAYGSC